MKRLLLFISFAVFGFAAYYFANNIKYSTDLNYIIYMATWLILILISIVGILYNFPFLGRQKRQVKDLIYNSYSNKRIRNKAFDSQFHILN